MQNSGPNAGKPSFGVNQAQQKMSDEDIMNDLLSQEKQMISSYSTLLCEASCPNLRSVLTDNLTSSAQDQYQVFDQMSQRGWYPTKNANQPDVMAAKQKFAQMKSQLG